MRAQFVRVFLFVFCLASTPILLSQATASSTTTSNDTTHAPDPDSGMSGHVDGLFIPLVTGQPFHAKIPVEIHRQLPDGTVVNQKYYTLVARDSNGREYREAREPVPADSDREPPLVRTIVYDPKTSTTTTCTPDQRTCRQTAFDPTQHPVEDPAGPSTDGKSVLTRESLGSKTIDGLECTGTRETRTFNPGAFGNDKPVVVTKGIWYSPQLQFNLSVTRLDPRNGTQKLDVTDLKLGDPGAEWFVTPDGYRVVMGRGIQPRVIYPAELEPVIEKSVNGMTADQLTTYLQPVEAAIGAYAKAHALASPNDKNDEFAGKLRQRLSNDLRMLQQNQAPQKAQLEESDLRMNETFREVVSSPCIDKPQPGDSPSIPTNAEGLRAEQTAWLAVRDAWVAFLTKLFPNSDPAGFAWMITNERDSELRRLVNIERNRGCVPEESIEPLLVRYITGLTADQLDAALKPVDAAIRAYAKAHAEAEPGEQNDNFTRMLQQQLANLFRMQQRNRIPSQDDYEEADLHLNQAFRAVISSPCLAKPIPGDPPNAPVNEEKLRAEEQSWIAMRDAWTAFMAVVFPTANHDSFGTMLTEMRTGELQQIQNIERNRGCVPAQ
jgi:uncharacterized protein YecT (DUF1311 family)